MHTPQNRAVVYKSPNTVAVETVPYPTLKFHSVPGKSSTMHGVIIKLVATNICGSDLHMVRGRLPIPSGYQLGHEMTGEIVEVGPDVENFKAGDLVSVPFNVSCGRCTNCFEGFPNTCLNTNPTQPGGGYGYFGLGDWPGGQAMYAMVPYADFNLLPLGPKSHAMPHILDLAFLSDILPTGFDAVYRAGVKPGDSVYIAGAGPVGLAAAASCLQLLGAGQVIVSDYEPARLRLAEAMGCETVDLNTIAGKTHGLRGLIRSMLGKGKLDPLVEAATGGERYIDVGIDAAGFECCGKKHGIHRRTPAERAEVLNDLFKVVKPRGTLGVPGVYLHVDEGATDEFDKRGGLQLEWGLAFEKGLTINQGQCPVKRYNEHLYKAIMADRFHLASYLNTQVISLDEVPQAYRNFSNGAPVKYVIDPHGMIPASVRKTGVSSSLGSAGASMSE